MKLRTAQNECTFIAENHRQYELLVMLYHDLAQEVDVTLDAKKQELSIETYF